MEFIVKLPGLIGHPELIAERIEDLLLAESVLVEARSASRG